MTPYFSKDTYSARRDRLLNGLGDVAVIIGASPHRTKSRDVEYPYRPNNDLLYLTGYAEPNAVAVLVTSPRNELTLFVRPKDPEKEQWEGLRSGVEGAKENFADQAFDISELETELPGLISGRDAVYFALGEDRHLDRIVMKTLETLRGGRGKPNLAPDAIIDPRRKLHDLRRVKTAEEIEVLTKACAITAETHRLAMEKTIPGTFEYQLAAFIDFEFKNRGAAGPGYDSIVGGGVNATILHYTENSAPLKEGDLVLIDAGAEMNFYNADITRTFPVGARFTPAQKDLYQAVLDVEEEAISLIKPGISAVELTEWSRRALTEKLVLLKLLDGEVDGLVEQKAYQRFYMHNLGHYLGMDVHDVGTYLIDEGQPLPMEPGVVLTIEPGLYIPNDDDIPPEMRGIGIRIEDDLLVTSDGAENLTADAPKSVKDIEALRKIALENGG